MQYCDRECHNYGVNNKFERILFDCGVLGFSEICLKHDNHITGLNSALKTTEKHSAYHRTLASRRKLLSMGAAGLPMVLTLSSSARANLVSQLSCVFTISGGIAFLVNKNGKVWMANRTWTSVPPITRDIYRDMKSDAIYSSGGLAPSSMRPSGVCDYGPDLRSACEDYNYATTGNSDTPLKCTKWSIRRLEREMEAVGALPSGYVKLDDRTFECKYSIYLIPNTLQVPANSMINGNETNWSYSNDAAGLYTKLGVKLANQGHTTGFPGISCLISVINYFNTL